MENYNPVIHLREIRAKMAELKAQEKDIVTNIMNDNAGILEQAFDDYGCGTANINVNGEKVKIVITKRIDWDQAFLADMAKKIADGGKNPLEYIKVSYDVSEAAYKAWPSEIRAAFEAGRTVRPSSPSIKLEG